MKKSIYLVMLFLIVTTTSMFAQMPTFTWAKANFGGTNDEATGVAIDTEQNVIEIGYFRSYFSGGEFNLQGNTLPQSPPISGCNYGESIVCPYADSYIVKYDVSGNVIWHLRSTGNQTEYISSVTTDNQNNIYVCGNMNSDNGNIFSYVPTDALLPAMFVMKLSPSGSVLWFKKVLSTVGVSPNVTQRGGNMVNLKTDSNGNVYVSGNAIADNIVAGTLSLNLINVNNQYRQECFIAKYDTNGNPLWLKGIQGSGIEEVSKIGVDATDNVYFSGITYSPNLIISSSSYPTGNNTNGTMNSSFTVKMDTNGNPVWLDFSDYADISLFGFSETTADSEGNVYCVGTTNGVELGPYDPHTITFGPSSVTIPYIPDVRRDNVLVVCKYSPTGQKLWMKTSPSNLYIQGTGIDIDANDKIYITGQYIVPTVLDGFNLPNSDYISASVSTSNPEYKNFIAQIDSQGNFIWARQTGQHYSLEVRDFEVDNNGSIVIGGKFIQGSSINFDGTLLSGYINSSTFRDAFIAKYNTLAPLTTPVITARSTPFGLALGANHKLYIAESGTINGNKITEADLSASQPIVNPLFTTNLNRPTRLKWTADNYLYVTETGSSEISRANLSLASPPMQSYFSSGLVTPFGLDVKDGNLYIGDYGNYAIKRVNTSAAPFQITLLTNNLATDIVIDGDLFYYTNPDYGNVLSSSILNPSTISTQVVTGIAHPSSLLLNNGLLYISDSAAGKIYSINPYSNSTIPELILSGLNAPQSMIVYNNELYIAESSANRIVKINLNTLGNAEIENAIPIVIAPNPAQNILNIHTQETIKEVLVYDMLGKKVNTTQVSNNTLDVSNLAQGLYIIKVIGEKDKMFSSKFIKK
jgi:hypothetical protein